MAAIVAVCAVRGLGFAISVVVGSALVAMLVPAERRGEGLGVYGIVVGVPSVVALPLGVWLAGRVGYPPVFVTGGLAALAGLTAMPKLSSLPGRRPTPERSVGVLAGLRTPALVRPSVVFSATTMAAGVVVTFLPLAVTQASGNLAALALLAQAAAARQTPGSTFGMLTCLWERPLEPRPSGTRGSAIASRTSANVFGVRHAARRPARPAGPCGHLWSEVSLMGTPIRRTSAALAGDSGAGQDRV